MAKKSDKKDVSSKPKPLSNRELQFAVIENFINMQKVLTNLTIKFELLSDNVSKLLQLFEISAKSFIMKQEEPSLSVATEDKDLLKKLDTLLDQNKTIAKGLTLIEEKIRHKMYEENPSRILSSIESEGMHRPHPRPLPKI